MHLYTVCSDLYTVCSDFNGLTEAILLTTCNQSMCFAAKKKTTKSDITKSGPYSISSRLSKYCGNISIALDKKIIQINILLTSP